MPWDIKAMKDVGCLRKASVRWLPTFDPAMSEWENPALLKQRYALLVNASKPAEVKHLSKRRKRK